MEDALKLTEKKHFGVNGGIYGVPKEAVPSRALGLLGKTSDLIISEQVGWLVGQAG